MPNKTILQLTGMKSTHYGAKEQYFLEFARTCCQRGYQCILQYESLPDHLAYINELKECGADVVIVPTYYRHPVWSIPQLIQLIYAIRPEILETHFVNRYIRLAAPVIARMSGARKCVAFVRNLPSGNKWGLRRFLYNNRYDRAFAVSQAVADDLIRCGVNPDIVSTLYWGLIGLRERSEQCRVQFRKEFGLSDHAVVFGIIATDSEFKGLDILLDAFAQVISKAPHVHLLEIGVNPETSTLPEQAGKLGIADHIHWAGIRDDGWRLLNAVDIYVQSSTHLEGLPMAVIEAMSLKLPVVATRVSGIPEAVIDGETGYLATPNNVDRLAAALIRILDEPSKWQTLGASGYQRYIRIFDSTTSINRLLEEYFG